MTDINGVRRTVRVRASDKQLKPAVERVIPTKPTNFRPTPPTPTAEELKVTAKLPEKDQQKLARGANSAPETYAVLAASKSPYVRNELSINKEVDGKALSIIVSVEAKVSRFNKEADEFRGENLINVALHPNTPVTTLRQIMKIKTSNEWARKIAGKRIRGEDYIPAETVNQMSTRSHKTGFWNEKDSII